MLKFRCSECLAVILVDADLATDSAVCSNCNTRQLIPDDAMAVSEEVAKKTGQIPFGTIVRTPVPHYPMANILGAFFIVIGLVGAAVCLLVGIAAPPMLLGIVSSLTLSAIGVVMHLLRDIAIDVRRIRDA